MEKEYRIKTKGRAMQIIRREDSHLMAEYALEAGREKAQVVAMRRAIDAHMDNGGSLENYQW